jgi:hypothetical protein
VSGLNRLLGSGANRTSLADAAQWPNGFERSSHHVMTDSHRCMLLVANPETGEQRRRANWQRDGCGLKEERATAKQTSMYARALEINDA